MDNIRAMAASSLIVLGPWAPFVVGLLDSSFLPLAQSVDLLIIAQAAITPQTAMLGAALAVAGSTLGSFILYSVARHGGRALLEKRVAPRKLEKVRLQLEKYDALALALPTMLPLPLPMRPLVIAAGVFGMGRGRFVAVIAGARSVRYLGIAILTVNYGESALALLSRYGLFALLAGAGIGTAAILAGYVYRQWRRKSALSSANSETDEVFISNPRPKLWKA